MRNSVVRFAAGGAGQDLPGVGREFWGRVSWTTFSSCRAGRPAMLVPRARSEACWFLNQGPGAGQQGRAAHATADEMSGGAVDLRGCRRRRRRMAIRVRLFSRFLVFQGF